MAQTKPDTDTEPEPSLDAYRFYEQDWAGYEELRAAFEHEVPERFNMATYLCDRWARADPDRVAMYAVDVDGTDTEYTYDRLHEDANRLANFLADQGIEAGDRIAVNGAQKVECVATHLAAWKLGAISVPLSLLFGPDGLRYRLADSGASAFVVDEGALSALRGIDADLDALETILTVGDVSPEGKEAAFRSAIEEQPTEFDTATTGAEEPAIIMYTSGTTGPPKRVVHAHRIVLGVLPSHVTSIRNMDLQANDVLYTPGEWSWAGPMYGYLLSGLYYGTSIVGDANPGFDPERTLELVERYDVVGLAAPTTAYRVIMQLPEVGDRFDLSSLRVVFEGGEALGESVVEWWRETVAGVAVHEGFGQTETAAAGAGDCEALGIDHRDGYIGRPAPGQGIEVLDIDDADSVGPGEVGELAVYYAGNPACFLEFWNAPEKTARRIDGGWLRTEDLGSKSDDGYLSFHSRADDVIISAGYRIGPAEIEESLATHEAVADAGVIGVPDETRGGIPKAFVVLGADHDPAAELEAALQAHAKERLAKHEYPRELEFVAELPKTTTGKVRRHDLREREGPIEE
jgi:acetyl-CoA synthetase